MKVKLKKGEKLSSNMNYCNLDTDSWIALNQGKQVELDVIPDSIKDKIEINSSNSYKKGDK
tara:strand:+ start:224 stop:406 length:183 start_codon:yes stop_codon:yes gene_type:complete